jgi:hypothetical protein
MNGVRRKIVGVDKGEGWVGTWEMEARWVGADLARAVIKTRR